MNARACTVFGIMFSIVLSNALPTDHEHSNSGTIEIASQALSAPLGAFSARMNRKATVFRDRITFAWEASNPHPMSVPPAYPERDSSSPESAEQRVLIEQLQEIQSLLQRDPQGAFSEPLHALRDQLDRNSAAMLTLFQNTVTNRNPDVPKALDALAASALYLLERSGSDQKPLFDRRVMDKMAEVISVFNEHRPTGLKAFPKVSIPLLFSGVSSVIVIDDRGPEPLSHLEQLVKNFTRLPLPYRDAVILFHLFNLGSHYVSFTKGMVGESVDVRMTNALLHDVLARSKSGALDPSRLRLVVPKVWEFYFSFPMVQQTVADLAPGVVLAWYTEAIDRDKSVKVPIIPLRFGSTTLEWFFETEFASLPIPLDEVLIGGVWNETTQNLFYRLRPPSNRNPLASRRATKDPVMNQTPFDVLLSMRPQELKTSEVARAGGTSLFFRSAHRPIAFMTGLLNSGGQNTVRATKIAA